MAAYSGSGPTTGDVTAFSFCAAVIKSEPTAAIGFKRSIRYFGREAAVRCDPELRRRCGVKLTLVARVTREFTGNKMSN